MTLVTKLFVLASLFAFALASTSKDVLADVTSITTAVDTLNQALDSFPPSGGTVTQALEIHMDANYAALALQKGSSDAKASHFGAPHPFSDADAATILQGLQTLEPVISNTAKVVVERKPAFAVLPLQNAVALVKEDLGHISGNVTSLASALAAAFPPDKQAALSTLVKKVDSVLSTAVDAYN